MLNGQKKKKNTKNSKFHYSFNNFGRDPPHEYTCIFGNQQIWYSDLFFHSEEIIDVIWTFTPIWSHVKKKKLAKNLKFHNSLNNSTM